MDALTLPCAKVIYVEPGYFEKYDQQVFEWQGVPPDIRVVQKAEDIETGRDRQLEFAIEVLK